MRIFTRVVLILIVIICLSAMFLFLKNMFGTNVQNNQSVTSQTEQTLPDTPSVPYSMDFTGADYIIVTAIDHSKKDKPTRTQEIKNPEKVQRIISLLSTLPKDGKLMVSWGPVIVSTITAYKQDVPFATVSFYEDVLKTESTGFIDHDTDVTKEAEKELFLLISSGA